MPAILRAGRAYARVDQKTLADRLGVSARTVSAWECGSTSVPKVARPGVIQGLVDLGVPRSFFDGRETDQ